MTSNPQSTDEIYNHRSRGRSRAAFVSALWAGLNAAMPAASGLLIFSLCSRILQPPEFGIVVLASAIVMFATGFTPAGFGEAIIQKRELQKVHLDTLFWLCLAASVIAYFVLLLLAYPLSLWFEDSRLTGLLAFLGVKLICDTVSVVPNATLARSMSFNILALRTVIATVFSTLTCLFLLYLGWGLWALALSFVASSFAGAAVSIMSAKWRPSLSFSAKAIADLMHVGLFTSASKLVQLLNLEQLLIASLLGTTALGLYGFARRIFQILNDLIAGALNTVSFSLMSSLQNEKEKLRDAFLLAAFASAAASFPIFIGLVATAEDVVPLAFGDQWVGAVPVLYGFCFFGLLTCIGVLQSALINSHGKAAWWLYYQLGQMMLSIAVILVVYRFGVAAIVAAITIKAAVAFPFPIYKCLRIIGTSPSAYARQFVGPAVASTAMWLGVQALRYETVGDVGGPWLVAAEVALGATIYLAVLLILSWKEFVRIKNLIRSR